MFTYSQSADSYTGASSFGSLNARGGGQYIDFQLVIHKDSAAARDFDIHWRLFSFSRTDTLQSPSQGNLRATTQSTSQSQPQSRPLNTQQKRIQSATLQSLPQGKLQGTTQSLPQGKLQATTQSLSQAKRQATTQGNSDNQKSILK